MTNAMLTSLETIVKPELEPVTLEDAIDWIHGSDADETKMRRLIPSCRSILERKLGIAFLTQQLRATFEFGLQTMGLIGIAWSYENMLCTLPRPPLQTIDIAAVESDIDVFSPITTATYDSIRQFPAQVYFYGDAFGMVEYPWWINLNREPRVQITYTCGYKQVSDIPEEYLMLLLQMLASTYLQAEGGGVSPELGSSILGNKVLEL
jgi:hypothetical protein